MISGICGFCKPLCFRLPEVFHPVPLTEAVFSFIVNPSRREIDALDSHPFQAPNSLAHGLFSSSFAVYRLCFDDAMVIHSSSRNDEEITLNMLQYIQTGAA
jgi:hypothetical protein